MTSIDPKTLLKRYLSSSNPNAAYHYLVTRVEDARFIVLAVRLDGTGRRLPGIVMIKDVDLENKRVKQGVEVTIQTALF